MRGKEDFGGCAGEIDGPNLRVFADEIEAGAEGFYVVEQVLADHAHDFPERLAGLETGREREATQESNVDR